MIEFRNVSKVYKQELVALEQVNFRIEAGDFVFFIGESGAGKSTLIKLLTCEERPSSGTVILDQFDVSRLRRRDVPLLRRKIGMIFQDFRLIDSKTVFENVAFAMEIVGAPKAFIKRKVPMVLSVVGLRTKAEAYPHELSGGEAQRVGIARAMINNPRLILADEPTGNLDPANSEAIMALLEEINRAGTTVIACTHDLSTVERMGKRVIEIAHGQIIRDAVNEPKTNVALQVYVDQSAQQEQAEQSDFLRQVLNEQNQGRRRTNQTKKTQPLMPSSAAPAPPGEAHKRLARPQLRERMEQMRLKQRSMPEAGSVIELKPPQEAQHED